uniref:Uncharacterized protein n=1 Tax=Anguilla anguilla TaxID=7936 RepID=A0A0E9QJR6_ANGAN
MAMVSLQKLSEMQTMQYSCN